MYVADYLHHQSFSHHALKMAFIEEGIVDPHIFSNNPAENYFNNSGLVVSNLIIVAIALVVIGFG